MQFLVFIAVNTVTQYTPLELSIYSRLMKKKTEAEVFLQRPRPPFWDTEKRRRKNYSHNSSSTGEFDLTQPQRETQISCSYPTKLSQNVIPQKTVVRDEISVIFVLKRGAEVSGSASLQRRIRLYTDTGARMGWLQQEEARTPFNLTPSFQILWALLE